MICPMNAVFLNSETPKKLRIDARLKWQITVMTKTNIQMRILFRVFMVFERCFARKVRRKRRIICKNREVRRPSIQLNIETTENAKIEGTGTFDSL